MTARTRALLLAGVAMATLPLEQPAQALLEPRYGCGVVATRDQLASSSNQWVAVMYAYVQGTPSVHTQVVVTCWLQGTASYSPPMWGDRVTCGFGSTWRPEVRPLTGCADVVFPSSYINSPEDSIYWCAHARWVDKVTATAVTRRTSTCVEAVDHPLVNTGHETG